MKTYIGIDNGMSGAVAAVGPHGHLIGWAAMPTHKARKGNECDVTALLQVMMDLTGGDRENVFALLEEPGGSKSAKAATSMSGCYHAIRAVLDIKRIPWTPVTPREWQKVMLPGCKAGDTKPAALTVARRIWPDENWLVSDRCKTPHDGAVDAALIAEFGRRAGL